MQFFIGIDGGGSKTIFCLLDNEGKILRKERAGSACYKQIGMKGLSELLSEGIKKITAGLPENAVYYTCFGMPNYGESLFMDQQAVKMVRKKLSGYHVKIVNDSEVGWAASLLMEPGINIVAGTGSIAYGKNELGEHAKAGGWSEWFSDEGSGHWLGIKCMELFSKEADGRLQRGELYGIVRRNFQVEQDIEMIDIFETQYHPYRDKTASLQKLLYEAASAGDKAAIQVYKEAAGELANIVSAVKAKLFSEENCLVSYSGGVFKTGRFVLTPFLCKMNHLSVTLVEPKREPYAGAGLLAKFYKEGQLPSQEFMANTKEGN